MLWKKCAPQAKKKFISYKDYERIVKDIATYEEYNALYFELLFTCIYAGIYSEDLSVIKNIEHNNSFCNDNVEHMKVIGHCAFIVGILIILGDLFVFVLGLLHPGLLLFSLIIIFIAGAFCVVSYSLSSLIKQAVYIKEENDLTI